MKKKVLLLGASGNIAPHLLSGLEPYYDLHLADIKPHPDGNPILSVDVTSYEQVLEAARDMDAIMNFTVVRGDPVQSFHVSTRGAWHVMKAAAELGIKKVIHTGPQSIRGAYDHDFDVIDVPRSPGVNYYGMTKLLAMEICRIYARVHGIQTICFVFNGLGPSPTEKVSGKDFPPFTIVWEDLQHACRLALEIESVPDNFQDFNMLSYEGHGKYRVDKARRILGFEPREQWEDYFKRTP
ncbi:MAG: NAD(P)-dependent oxidoreductase [Candidatus Poribacteria bacterium]|nr:NAD(P)-dependent oxidoreductase [Candidatus Poribacteria bacterium]